MNSPRQLFRTIGLVQDVVGQRLEVGEMGATNLSAQEVIGNHVLLT